MQVFISHPHEYESQAADVAAKLRVQGHSVFLDRDSLPPGDSFDDRIRAAVAACDLFLFFIGPDSLARGRYTLTELGYAKERWKNPRGRVLPVMVGDTDIERVDPYLRSVSILQTTGDFATEVANRAAEMLRAGRASAGRRLGAWIRGWISTVASTVLGAVLGFLAGGFAGERLIGGQPEDFKYLILAGVVGGGTTGLLASRYWQRRASASR